ncbi:MAG: hypothetical protein ACOX6S_06545 [Clostridia bacterium]
MLRKGIVFLCCIGLLTALMACGGGSREASVPRREKLAPKSPIKGYYDVDQSFEGGEETDDVNLKAMTIREENGETLITMDFVYGSIRFGVDEAGLDAPPLYITEELRDPYRFVLHVDGLNYWDYTVDAPWEELSFVKGHFKELPMDNTNTALYFQLAGPAAYQVEEDEGRLVLKLRPLEGESKKAYYVVMNAFDEYQNDEFPRDAGLTPSLCEDGMNVTLISQPFSTEKEAEKFEDSLVRKLGEKYAGKVIRIIELDGKALPPYDKGADLEGIEKKPMIKAKGETHTLPVLIPDGRFLDWSLDKKAFVYAKPLSDEEDIHNDLPLINEEVWIGGVDGQRQPFMENEFSSILQARFSPDGKKLALLEQLEDFRILYIYDIETKEILDLSDEGFGTHTITFCWSDDSRTVYAMTGEEEPYLMAYDLEQDPDERLRQLEDQPGTYGDVEFWNDRLYFADENAGDGGVIYSLDPAGGSRAVFAQGSSLKLSPDGEWMAIEELMEGEEDELLTRLKIRNMANGEERIINEGKLVMSYQWSWDGDKLYYTVDKGMDVDEEELFATNLRVYSLSSQTDEELFDLMTSEFYLSNEPDQLLLVDMYMSEGNYIPVTYKLDIKKFIQ